MNIQYLFSVLVFSIVLERSNLDCYTTLRFVCESFFHFLPMRGRLNCFQQRMIGRFLIHDFFVTGIGHIITFNVIFFCQIFELNIYELSFFTR